MAENGEAKEEDSKGMEKERAKEQAKVCMGWTSWAHGEAKKAGTRAVEANGHRSHGEASGQRIADCGRWALSWGGR